MVSGGATLLAPPLAWLLIYYLEWGFDGCPIAMTVSSILTALGLIFIIVLRSELRNTCWSGWSWEAWTNWGSFFALGIPGLVMLCAEWWAFELLAILAGWQGDDVLAAHSIVINVNTLFFMVPWGLGDVASVRVGRLLGANRPMNARYAAETALKMIVVMECILVFLLVIFRRQVPHLFSNIPEVINLAANTTELAALFMVFDGCQAVMGGILRGAGHQDKAARVNLIAFYLVALPSSYFLAKPYGIYGIWMGVSFGSLIQVTGQGSFLLVLDWREASRQAVKRTSNFIVDGGASSVHIELQVSPSYGLDKT